LRAVLGFNGFSCRCYSLACRLVLSWWKNHHPGAASGPTRGQVDEKGIRKFELHYLIQLYHSFLTGGGLRVSPILEEYFLENDIRAEGHLNVSIGPPGIYPDGHQSPRLPHPSCRLQLSRFPRCESPRRKQLDKISSG